MKIQQQWVFKHFFYVNTVATIIIILLCSDPVTKNQAQIITYLNCA